MVSRRTFLGFFAAAAAVAVRSSARARGLLAAALPDSESHPSQLPTFRPETFGARADGKTDCYEAFQSLVRAVNAAGSGRIEFSQGTYLVNRYIIAQGADSNGVQPFLFQNVRGLYLAGNGAKLDHKGDFHRRADKPLNRNAARNRKQFFSNISSVSWVFRHCSNVTVEHLELDGNADRMTKDPGVIEDSFGHGLRFSSCSGVSLNGVYVHHWASDGLNFRRVSASSGAVSPCTHVKCTNVRSLNNGRQGMTVASLYGGLFADCEFSGTGITEGMYGGHAPKAGVDIEPLGSEARGKVTQNTGNLQFVRCKFLNNLGSIFTAPYIESYAGQISLSGCTLDVGDRADALNSRVRFILQAPQGLVENSSINLRGGEAHLTWRANAQSHSVYRNVEFTSAGTNTSVSSKVAADLEIDTCRFILESQNPLTQPFVKIDNPAAVVRENYFFIPSAARSRRGIPPAVVIKASIIDGNRYETDPGANNQAVVVTESGQRGPRGASVTGNVQISGSR